MSTKPRVAILALGGTIAMARIGEGERAGRAGRGVVPALDAEALVSSVPALAEVAEITAVSFRQLPGAHLSMQDAVDLAHEATRTLEGGATGVVVTMGTDTIEEMAFALDLLVDRDEPVVVTGAMRNPTLPGADGPANLLASVRVAASPSAAGLGTLVVFNDEIHAARFVRKGHTSSPATFRSPHAGPLGQVIEARVRMALRVPHRRHIGCPPDSKDRQVALLSAVMGDDGRLLELVARTGYEGLVVEAFGGGHVPDTWADKLGELAAEIPVVLASRTGAGEMLRETYGFRGSESDLLARGLLSAGQLDGRKARVLLALLLRGGAGGDRIAAEFGEW
jgi:L-asparaginase